MSAADVAALRRQWDRARKAWNRDNGPIEATVNAGENLYFAASNLIEALSKENAA